MFSLCWDYVEVYNFFLLLCAIWPVDLIYMKEVILTVEMPDQQSGHERNNRSKDNHTDHGPHFAWTLCLLKLFIIWSRQELYRGVPVFVLEDRQTVE